MGMLLFGVAFCDSVHDVTVKHFIIVHCSFLTAWVVMIVYVLIDRYPYDDEQIHDTPVRNCPQVTEIDRHEHLKYQ